MNVTERIKDVLSLECEAIALLRDNIPDNVSDAVSVIASTKGKVILSGMGKSGIVAKKIAATMSSLGLPAFFLHPGDGLHGDIGAIEPSDTIMVLSNSGESIELLPVIIYARNICTKSIVITSNPNSTLAKQCDIAIVIPNVKEACHLGMAPSSSTTAMLALGDAIAISISEQKGFDVASYKTFHPAGGIGRRLLTVKEVMRTGSHIPLISGISKMSDAIIEMSTKSLGCVGIVDNDGKLRGIISDGDIRRHMAEGLLDMNAADVMSINPKTINDSSFIHEAIEAMNSMKITFLFVMQDSFDIPIGIIHLHDCLRTISGI